MSTNRSKIVRATLLLVVVFVVALGAMTAAADSQFIDFETYAVGNINGQDGWLKTGPFDVAIVDQASLALAYPGFGTRSLRISNATTSGSFGDQTFSKPLVDEAGETGALNGGMSGGTRQAYYMAEWEFASTVPGAEQPGLSAVASPDRGDGARMSWVQMADTPTGLVVRFNDYASATPGVCDGAFTETTVATGLDRTVKHSIRITMRFYDTTANDVVKVYVDGVLVHTGTSWEDYFRDCQPPGTRTVDSILFRVGGTAAPATAGKGFLIDNFRQFSGPITEEIFVSATAAGTTSDLVDFGAEDILMWDDMGWSLWFDGSAAGLTPVGKWKHNLNAVYIPDPAGSDVVVSFTQNARHVPGIVPKVDGMDLVMWDGLVWTLYFDGSDVDLNNKTQEKIDALHILPASPGCLANLLISTQGPGRVTNGGAMPGFKFAGEDVLNFCATSLGDVTAGTWSMVLDGSAEGMPRNSTDSISMSADGNTLYLTTKKNFTVDAAAGGHSMVYTYDMTAGTFAGPFFDAPAEGLPKQVDALQVYDLP